MHYLLVTDSQGDHVLFKGTRETLEKMAEQMRRDLPALRIRIASHAVVNQRESHADVRAEGWVAPRTG
jgi:hypothetical protein